MEGKVWILDYERYNSSFGYDGGPVMFKTKSFIGPFEGWSEAVRYVEDNNKCGVEIYDFT